MRDFILTESATLVCPHGGVVMHIPSTVTSYRVDGQPPLLLMDNYIVTGCANNIAGLSVPCFRVLWSSPSTMLYIKGNPALLHTSHGICEATLGIVNGIAIPISFQTSVREPDEFTHIQD